MREDEKVLEWFSPAFQFFEAQPFERKMGNRGYLVVTSRRLLFSHKSGMFSEDYAMTWGTGLEDIMSVSHGKYGPIDKLMILYKDGRHADFVGKNSQMAIPIINDAMARRVSEIETARKRESVVISLDFSWLKDYMQKGGIVLATVKCPNCGGGIKLPEAGGSVKCESCRSEVLAVDIFKKIKELIG